MHTNRARPSPVLWFADIWSLFQLTVCGHLVCCRQRQDDDATSADEERGQTLSDLASSHFLGGPNTCVTGASSRALHVGAFVLTRVLLCGVPINMDACMNACILSRRKRSSVVGRTTELDATVAGVPLTLSCEKTVKRKRRCTRRHTSVTTRMIALSYTMVVLAAKRQHSQLSALCTCHKVVVASRPHS